MTEINKEEFEPIKLAALSRHELISKIRPLLTTIESQTEIIKKIRHEWESTDYGKRNIELTEQLNYWRELANQRDVKIESQKEEIERLLALVAEKEDKSADYFDQEGEVQMSDIISRKALLNFIDVSVEGVPCKYISIDLLRRETNNGTFNIPTTESEGEIESLKAITELAVKGLKEISENEFVAKRVSRTTLSEIAKLSHE